MSRLRIVLDTNTVLMPILREASADSWLRKSWEQDQFTPLISDYTESELIKTLGYRRFRLEVEQVERIAGLYLDHCTKIEIPEPPPETPLCQDPNDQPFLILAYQANADYLVTKDGDLLVLRDDSEIPIIRVQDLLAILRPKLKPRWDVQLG